MVPGRYPVFLSVASNIFFSFSASGIRLNRLNRTELPPPMIVGNSLDRTNENWLSSFMVM